MTKGAIPSTGEGSWTPTTFMEEGFHLQILHESCWGLADVIHYKPQIYTWVISSTVVMITCQSKPPKRRKISS